MITPREKAPLLEEFSSEEDRTHDTALSRTGSPTHNQQATPAQSFSKAGYFFFVILTHTAIQCLLEIEKRNSVTKRTSRGGGLQGAFFGELL